MRATVLSIFGSVTEEGNDVPVLMMPGQRVILKAMNRLNASQTKVGAGGKHEDDSSQEEGIVPTGDTDDSASVATENGKEEVDTGPPPPGFPSEKESEDADYQ